MENDLDFGDSDLLESLNQQLSFLNDKFKVYESLHQDQDQTNESNEQGVGLYF